MPNMSYCRFENTFRDLQECECHILDESLSDSEAVYRKKLIELCQLIGEEE